MFFFASKSLLYSATKMISLVLIGQDIVWQLKNKSRDYYDLNAANLSAMTNFFTAKWKYKSRIYSRHWQRLQGGRHKASAFLVNCRTNRLHKMAVRIDKIRLRTPLYLGQRNNWFNQNGNTDTLTKVRIP